MKDWIKIGPSVVAVVSSLTVLVSVLYEWAYYQYIDINLFGIMSMADFATTALQWLPLTLCGALAGIALSLFTRHIEGGRSEEEIALQSKHPKFTYKFRRFSEKAFVFIVVFVGPVNFFIDPRQLIIPIGLSIGIGWVVFVIWILQDEKIKEKISLFKARVFIFAPMTVVLTLAMGAERSRADMSSSVGDFSIIVKDYAPIDNAQILRMLSNGVLIRDHSKERIVFLLWNQVEMVSRDDMKLETQPRSCHWFGMLCRPKDS